MSVTLKKDSWKIKDGNGTYRDSAIFSTTLPEDAAAIVAEATSAIDAQQIRATDIVGTATDEIDTIVQRVNDLVDTGTDTTLTQAGAAADAKVTGNVRDALYYEINTLHSLIDYGPADAEIIGNPSAAIVRNKYSISKCGTKIVITGPSSSSNIRFKVSEELAVGVTNSDIDAWNQGINLENGRAYRATLKYISGTITTSNTLPTISIYKVGTHNSIGTGTSYETKYIREFVAPVEQVNLVIYLNTNTEMSNVVYQVILEDITGDEPMVASVAIDSGKYFTINNRLYIATESIAQNADIIPGTNCTLTNIADALNAINT